jgi:phage terminase large subunit
MGAYRDSLLPRIVIPDTETLKKTWFQLGSAKFQVLPKQFEFLAAQEQFLGYLGGYGSGKTAIGVIKAAMLSMIPNNRGIVGRLNGTDLDETAKRDLIDFLHEAELLKVPPNSKNNRAIVYCVDPITGKNLGYTSEIGFMHLDDPWHIRGRHLGWAWIDEGSEVHRAAWQNLIGRLRLPAARQLYRMMVTGNPDGHNWIYDFFFNQEIIENMICGLPTCKLSDKECNKQMRLKRRGVHCSSLENYFLPPEYLQNMLHSFSEEERRRYIDAEFECFEGQIYKEFSSDMHVLRQAA